MPETSTISWGGDGLRDDLETIHGIDLAGACDLVEFWVSMVSRMLVLEIIVVVSVVTSTRGSAVIS